MSVESFDPGAALPQLDAATLDRLLLAAADQPPEFGFTQSERARFATLHQVPAASWRAAVAALDDQQITALIHLLTQAAESIPGWEGGAKSPVIVLAAELKARGTYPRQLTAWIRAHSTNRFLPYGSLADRL